MRDPNLEQSRRAIESPSNFGASNVPAVFTPPAWAPATVAEAEPESAKGMSVSPALMMRAFRRRWWIILPAWLALSIVVVIVVYQNVKPVYESFALIKVDPHAGTLEHAGEAAGSTQFQATQVELIKTPDVLNAAIADNPDLVKLPILRKAIDPEAEIRKKLNVTIVKGTDLIQVSMASEFPEEAVVVINKVVAAYLKEADRWLGGEVKGKIERLDEEIKTAELKVTELRAKVRDLIKNAESGSREQMKKTDLVSIEEYRDLLKELVTLRDNLDIARLREAALVEEVPAANSTDPGSIDESIRRAAKNDPVVVDAAKKLANVQANMEGIKSKIRGPDITLSLARKKYEAIKRVYDSAYAAALDNARRRPAGERGGMSAAEIELLETRKRIAELTVLIQKRDQRIKTINFEVNERGLHDLELKYAEANEQSAQSFLEMLKKKKQDLEFESRGPKKVVLMQKAKQSNLPQSNKRKMFMAAAPIGIFGALFGLFIVLEMASGRVADPVDLTNRTRLKIIGVVPPLPAPKQLRGEKDQIRLQRKLHEFVQSVDHLRVNICSGLHDGVRDVRCILITSACGGEGKTTLAAQLAARCANAGLTTLLVDADLRNPSLSKLLDVPQGPGLIDMLRGDVDADAAMVVVGDGGGFHLLPSGTPEYDPNRLLQGARLGQLISSFRENFDLVIIDSPPILPVPDSLILGRWSDGAVLAVRHDTSRFQLIKQARERLASVGIPLLGAVVNGVSDSNTISYGGHGYYDGGRDPAASVDPVADAV